MFPISSVENFFPERQSVFLLCNFVPTKTTAVYVFPSDGKFGAYMQVHIQNDGPVTISLETPPPKPVQQKQVNPLHLIAPFK